MIKSVLFYFLLFFTFCIHAQKIKVKKGVVYIDKQKVGHVEKIKTDNDYYFQVTNIQNEKFCKVKQIAIPSLLFKGDKEYPHRIIYGDKIKDTIGITEKNYWLNSKRSIEYLSIIGLVSKSGFQTEKINDLVSKTSKYPEWIQKEIDAEKLLVEHTNHKVLRKVSDNTIILKELETTETRGQIKRVPVKSTKLNIFQKNGEEEILIGYAIKEVESISGYTYYYIFNTKDVPLSFYDTFKYKIYYPYKEYGLTNNKLKTIEGVENIITEMALDLVVANKL